MLLLGWGEIQVDDILISDFFRLASEELRGAAMSFIGRLLDSDSLPGEMVDRYMLLWGNRLTFYKERGGKEQQCPELENFGGWFICDKLNDEWLLSQLQDLLIYVNTIKLDHLVVKKLTELAETHPLQAIEILTSLFDKAKDPWALLKLRKEAKGLISRVV